MKPLINFDYHSIVRKIFTATKIGKFRDAASERLFIVSKCIALLLLVSAAAGIGKAWHWAKDGFTIRRIGVFSMPEIKSYPLDAASEAALQQKYYYLSRGHQCYAFVSEDGRYILKLPRYDLYQTPFWMRACRFPFVERAHNAFVADKQKRLRFLLGSFKIAFEELKEETALLYSHLGRTDQLDKTVLIQDRIGRSYSIDLDRTSFLLQTYQPLMMPLCQSSVLSGDREKAKEILNAFIELIALRAGKGIFNKDPSFFRNFGMKGAKGVQIDVGSFYRLQSGIFVDSFSQTAGHVTEWLARLDPEMAAWFDLQVQQILAKGNVCE